MHKIELAKTSVQAGEGTIQCHPQQSSYGNQQLLEEEETFL